VVSDKLANALVRIDTVGHVKQKLQKKGKTPGALNGPGLVATSGALVAVAGFASERIELYTIDLVPVAEIRAVGPVFSIAFDGKGCLWVGAMRGQVGKRFSGTVKKGTNCCDARGRHHGELCSKTCSM